MDEMKALGAITQLGSFGVIVYLIFWLTRNLPGWLSQWNATKIEIENIKVQNTRTVIEGQTSARAEFLGALQYEREMCEKQFHAVNDRLNAQTSALQAMVSIHEGTKREVTESLSEQMERLRTIDHTTRDIAQSRAMADAVQRAKRPIKPQVDEA